MYYSIIIPIYNEVKTLDRLLLNLKCYYLKGHEILLIDDGSNDGSTKVAKKYFYVTTVSLYENKGKGAALRAGLLVSKNQKIIIFDGDLELNTSEISKLMILDFRNGISCVMGFRFNNFIPYKSKLDWGNFMFTTFFNLINITNYKDVLCCAKSFYKRDIFINKLQSVGFDIDVELASMITYQNKRKNIKQQLLNYSRRSIKAGKKLKISDGWTILKRIIVISKNR
jgi:glycosyltransferase involved in cell wall biosynthesis